MKHKHTDCTHCIDGMCVCPEKARHSGELVFTHQVLSDCNAEVECEHFKPKIVDIKSAE